MGGVNFAYCLAYNLHPAVSITKVKFENIRSRILIVIASKIVETSLKFKRRQLLNILLLYCNFFKISSRCNTGWIFYLETKEYSKTLHQIKKGFNKIWNFKWESLFYITDSDSAPSGMQFLFETFKLVHYTDSIFNMSNLSQKSYKKILKYWGTDIFNRIYHLVLLPNKTIYYLMCKLVAIYADMPTITIML